MLAQLPAMEPVIDVVAVSEVDRLKPPRGQLLVHHGRVVGYLAALGAVRSPEDSWLVRRRDYLEWLQEPLARALFVGTEKVCAAMRRCASSKPRDVRGPRAPWASTSGKAPSTSRDASHAHHPVSARAGPATQRWRPDQAVRSSGPACAGRRRRVARPPGMTRRRRRAASVLADGTRPARPRYCRRIRRH